jgi:hypothetical protein
MFTTERYRTGAPDLLWIPEIRVATHLDHSLQEVDLTAASKAHPPRGSAARKIRGTTMGKSWINGG